jgi:hypothetical protein
MMGADVNATTALGKAEVTLGNGSVNPDCYHTSTMVIQWMTAGYVLWGLNTGVIGVQWTDVDK